MDIETKKELISLSRKVDSILNYLHNDNNTGELGLVAAFKEHEKKMDAFISDYENKEAVRKSTTKLVATFFGAVGTFITSLIIAIVERYKSNG